MTNLTSVNWTVGGVCLTNSEAMYQNLVEAVTSDNLSEEHLREITGHRAPITVNREKRHIELHRF